MKKKLLSLALCLCMTLALLPTAALAAEKGSFDSFTAVLAANPDAGDSFVVDGVPYVYGGDKGDTSVYVYAVKENTLYKEGAGYMLWVPLVSEETVTGGTMTLHGITNHSGVLGDAAFKVPGNTVVLLEGENAITRTSAGTRGIFSESGALTIKGQNDGSGKLTISGCTALQASSITISDHAVIDIAYPNGTSGILAGAGDVVITDSTVTVKSDGSRTGVGSGAILANDNQGLNGGNANVQITNSKIVAIDTTSCAINAAVGEVKLKDSEVVAIGTHDSMGAVSYSAPIVVDGGILYAENTGAGYDISYVTGNSSLNSAVVYYNSNLNYEIQVGSNIQYGNCSYDQTTGKITAGAGNGGKTYVYGAVTWNDDMAAPPSGVVSLVGAAVLTIPSAMEATLPKITIASKAALVNQGVLTVTGGIYAYGAISNSGTLNSVTMTGVKVGSVTTYTYTVSGAANYDAAFVDIGPLSSTENDILTVPAGTSLTVADGVTMDLTQDGLTAANLADYITVDGALIVKGAILLPEGTTAEQIKALNISGSGSMTVGGVAYAQYQGEWLALSGDVTYTGLDLSDNTPVVKTLYKAGETGIIVWEPTLSGGIVTGGTLTLNNAEISTAALTTPALNLPGFEVRIVLQGENELYVPADESAPTTPSGSPAAVISAGGDLILSGDGTLGLLSDGNAAAIRTPFTLQVESGTLHTDLLIYAMGQMNVNTGAAVTCSLLETQTLPRVNGTLNALAATDGNTSTNLTAYGTASFTPYAAAMLGSLEDRPVSVTVPAGAELTILNAVTLTAAPSSTFHIENGGGLTIAEGGTLDWSKGSLENLTHSGALENNGTLILPAGATTDVVVDQGLTGAGIVTAGEDAYRNDGTAMKTCEAIDLSRETGDSGELAADGYHWNSETKTLTLKNIVTGDITLPQQDCAITIEGQANVGNITFYDPSNGNDLTVSGGTLVAGGNISLMGDLTLTDVTLNGFISNARVGGDALLRITDSKVICPKGISWMTNGGIELANSVLTVRRSEEADQFWAEKLSMDDASVIEMELEITNYGNVDNGLDGVKTYLPNGYTLGKSGSANTILDAAGEPATGIVLKKASAPAPGLPAATSFTLTFETNGGSAIEKVSETSGTTIDLSGYKPTRAGYAFTGWYLDAALTQAVSSVQLSGDVTVYAKWIDFPFTDVSPDDYYEDAVEWAVENDITDGKTETLFAPGDTCTRAQTITFLWRAMGSPEPQRTDCPFTDVSAGAYYYKAVLWAVEKGITKGTTEATFSPDETVTRAQAVTFQWRTAGTPAASVESPFDDLADGAYYTDAVLWAVSEKITEGTTATTFSPNAPCTRAQIVTFLFRQLGK